MFQVKKTSQSKKVMKTMVKERRRKRHAEKNGSFNNESFNYGVDLSANSAIKSGSTAKERPGEPEKDKLKREKCENTSSNIQTEIRTDDFVVRLLLFNFLPIPPFKIV